MSPRLSALISELMLHAWTGQQQGQASACAYAPRTLHTARVCAAAAHSTVQGWHSAHSAAESAGKRQRRQPQAPAQAAAPGQRLWLTCASAWDEPAAWECWPGPPRRSAGRQSRPAAAVAAERSGAVAAKTMCTPCSAAKDTPRRPHLQHLHPLLLLHLVLRLQHVLLLRRNHPESVAQAGVLQGGRARTAGVLLGLRAGGWGRPTAWGRNMSDGPAARFPLCFRAHGPCLPLRPA